MSGSEIVKIHYFVGAIVNSKRLLRITSELWAFEPWLQELALEDPRLRDITWNAAGQHTAICRAGRVRNTARYVDSDFFWHLLGWPLGQKRWPLVGHAFLHFSGLFFTRMYYWNVLVLDKQQAPNMIYCTSLWSLDIRSNESIAKDFRPVVTRRGWQLARIIFAT